MLDFLKRKSPEQIKETVVTRGMWDALQADMKSLKSRQASLGELAIDNENRIAKLDARQEAQNQRFAAAVDQLDSRTQSTIGGVGQIMGRVDDLSALGKRVGRELDELKDELQHRLDAIGDQTSTLADHIGAHVGELHTRLEAQSLEAGVVDAKLESFRIDTQRAVAAVASASEESVAKIEVMRRRLDDLPEIAQRLVESVNKLHVLMLGEDMPKEPAPRVTQLSEVLAKAEVPNLDELRRFYADKEREAGDLSETYRELNKRLSNED